MSTYADLTAVPVALLWLKTHPAVLAEVQDATAVSGMREAPWPHVSLTTGSGGQMGDTLAGTATPEVAFEVWGHPDGRHGDAALSHLCGTIIDALLELRDTDWVPGTPIISGVRPSAPYPQTLTNKQRRWLFTVSFDLRTQG